jgi:hypothetical protein
MHDPIAPSATNDDTAPETQHPNLFDNVMGHIVFAIAASLTVTVVLGVLGYLVGRFSA